MTHPTVDILSLGGTIAMMPGDQDRDGACPSLDAKALSDAIPGAAGIARLNPISVTNLPSANLNVEHIGQVLAHAAVSEAAAIVVAQGTDTLEESSFIAKMAYGGSTPLVFTGAMRTPNQAGADGPRNLLDSIVTGLSGEAPRVSVVMNTLVHDPAQVRKRHTAALEAFESDDGPLGRVVEGALLWQGPLRAETEPVNLPADAAAVALLPMGLGADTRLADAVIACGYEGLVVEAFGAGHVSEAWADKLAELTQKIPVILASRCGQGPVHRRTYGYKGSEMDLLASGLVSAHRLDARKARLLLSLLLPGSSDWRGDFTRAIAALVG